MSTSTTEARSASALSVVVADGMLTVDLSDGRTLSVPLAWFPRLQRGSAKERDNWLLIVRGEGIHWPDLDEDIRVRDLLDGLPSGESQRSFQAWLDRRAGKTQSPAKRQSYLPEFLERVTISSLLDDETVYVVPWSIVADAEGRLWIQGDFDFTRDLSGTRHVRITRSGDSILVEQGTIGDHRFERRPVKPDDQMLPVTLRSESPGSR